MKKSVILFGIAVTLFILSCISFNKAYQQVRWHSSTTGRSVEVYAAYQKLLIQVNNAAFTFPGFDGKKRSAGNLFRVDSASVMVQLQSLRSLVIDSVNIRIAEKLHQKLPAELPWILRSNVIDSIMAQSSSRHLTALKEIDSLISKGISRTTFLFKYRRDKLEASLADVQLQIFVFLVSASLLLIYAIANMARQYTKRLQKEATLALQEKKFRALVENSHDLIVMVDPELRSLYRSPAAERITGFSDEERRVPGNIDQVHPDDRERIKAYVAEMRQSPGLVIPARYRILHRQGHYIWLEGTYTSLLHDPAVGAIVVNMRDVSRRMADEEELRLSEKRFRDTLENMMEGVQIIDFNWRYIYANDALITYSTYPKEAMVGRTVTELYAGVENSELYAVLKRCMEQRESHQLESEFTFPDGSKRHFDLRIQPVPEGIFILSIDITERKKAEEALQESIKDLSDYTYALNEAAIVAVTDQKGVIRHVNDNFCSISKYSREELIGNDHRLINSGYHSREFIRDMWRSIAGGRIWKGEIMNRAKDGSLYWVDTTIVPFINKEGKPYQYLAIRSDITDRKKGEDEVVKLNRLYEFISAINQSIVHIGSREELLSKACGIAADIGAFMVAWIEELDEGGRGSIAGIAGEAGVMAAIRRNEGRDYRQPVFRDTPLGMAIRSGRYAVNNRLQQDSLLAPLHEGFAGLQMHSAISLPIRMFGKMTGTFNLSSPQPDFFDIREIALLEEAAGDISFALENFEKARLHKRTQELVVANERRFRALLEKSTDLKTLTDAQGRFVYVSPSVLSTFGYHEREVLGKPSYEFFHPDDRIGLARQRNGIIGKPGAFFRFQSRILHKAGHAVWCEGTLTNLLDEPDVHALVSNFSDITERKRLEEQKEFDARNLSALINNTHDLLWSIDREFRLITFNRPFQENVKLISGQMLATGDGVFSAVLSAEQRARFESYYNRAFAGESFTALDVMDLPVDYAAEISFYPIRHGGQVIGTACHSRDVTGRRKAERERELMVSDLVRYTKNLEQFTYVVSHNLRAPVAHILGLANVLKTKLSEEDRERSQQYLFGAVNQLDTVIRDLNKILEVRAAPGLQRETIDLHALIGDVQRSVNDTIGQEDVVIEEDLEVGSISAFKSYAYSVFINLVGNAAKYRQRNTVPCIRITSRNRGAHIELRIADNGVGMDLEQYGDKVFGMYQRFHLDVSGKGLGLFMVRTQVEAMDGSIKVMSEPGRGTEFVINLPAGQ